MGRNKNWFMAAAIRSKNIINYLERPSRLEKEMVSEMDDRVREWVIGRGQGGSRSFWSLLFKAISDELERWVVRAVGYCPGLSPIECFLYRKRQKMKPHKTINKQLMYLYYKMTVQVRVSTDFSWKNPIPTPGFKPLTIRHTLTFLLGFSSNELFASIGSQFSGILQCHWNCFCSHWQH